MGYQGRERGFIWDTSIHYLRYRIQIKLAGSTYLFPPQISLQTAQKAECGYPRAIFACSAKSFHDAEKRGGDIHAWVMQHSAYLVEQGMLPRF